MEVVKILKAKNVRRQSDFISFLAVRDHSLNLPRDYNLQSVLWKAIRLSEVRESAKLQLCNVNT